jgi:hypothetical protein
MPRRRAKPVFQMTPRQQRHLVADRAEHQALLTQHGRGLIRPWETFPEMEKLALLERLKQRLHTHAGSGREEPLPFLE